MALSTAIRETATRLNRDRQHRAETRLEELVKVAGIPDAYEIGDRPGNIVIETHFARLYQLVDTEDERQAVVTAFTLWQRDEQNERGLVRDLSNDSVEFIKSNNDLFLDDGCGPDGRAA